MSNKLALPAALSDTPSFWGSGAFNASPNGGFSGCLTVLLRKSNNPVEHSSPTQNSGERQDSI